MNLFKRKNVLNQIQKHQNVPVVKIISGIKGAGKTTLLELLKLEFLSQGTPQENIIMVSFENSQKQSHAQIFKNITNELESKNKSKLLIDEISLTSDWQDILLDLIDAFDTDIYVTSSTQISSPELSKLKGRFTLTEVFPLSFEEYLEFKNIDKISPDTKDVISNFLRDGSFPLITTLDSSPHNSKQLSDGIFSNITLDQLCGVHSNISISSYKRIFEFLASNVGNGFSVNKIAEIMKQENISIAIETIYAYLDWIEECFLAKRCFRYCLKTKTELKTQYKCYLSDSSFVKNNDTNQKAKIENAAFFELLRRGYKPFVGKFGTDEISFVGTKRNDKIYVQILDDTKPTSDQQLAITKISDNYPKFILTLDPKRTGSVSGIKIIHLADFLLSDF